MQIYTVIIIYLLIVKNKIRLPFYVLFLIIFSCNKQPFFNEYAIVSAKKEATLAGIEILEMGGNAFDAMIACLPTQLEMCTHKKLLKMVQRKMAKHSS